MNSEKSFYFVVLSVFLVLTLVTALHINLYPPQLVLSQSIPLQSVDQQPVLSTQLTSQLTTQSKSTSANTNDFQAKAINPVLVKLNLYSPSSSNLLLGTAIQETFIGKLSKNIFQISLDTARDVNYYYLAKNPKLKAAVSNYYNSHKSLSWNLENNVAYEIAMARIVYLMKTSKPLPNATDLRALGRFWKINYNTYLGKGTASEYVENYEEYLRSHQIGSQYRTV